MRYRAVGDADVDPSAMRYRAGGDADMRAIVMAMSPQMARTPPAWGMKLSH